MYSLTWKRNSTDIVTHSNGSKATIYQVYAKNKQRLYIRAFTMEDTHAATLVDQWLSPQVPNIYIIKIKCHRYADLPIVLFELND